MRALLSGQMKLRPISASFWTALAATVVAICVAVLVATGQSVTAFVVTCYASMLLVYPPFIFRQLRPPESR